MSLIDTSYFVRDISAPVSSNATLNSNLTNSILRYENEILKSLLGYSLWKEFTDAIAASVLTLNPVPLAQKWVDLKNGAEFSFELNGTTITTKWNGLVNTDKISLISYYVYYKHRMDHDTEYTGIGEVSAKQENSHAANPLFKIVGAHNSMVELYGNIHRDIVRYRSFSDSANYVHYNESPSAYNFLLANISDYAGWRFTPIARLSTI